MKKMISYVQCMGIYSDTMDICADLNYQSAFIFLSLYWVVFIPPTFLKIVHRTSVFEAVV